MSFHHGTAAFMSKDLYCLPLFPKWAGFIKGIGFWHQEKTHWTFPALESFCNKGLDFAGDRYKEMLCESDIFSLKTHFNMNQRKSPARLSVSSSFHPPLCWLSRNKGKESLSKFPTGLSYNSIFFLPVDGWEAEQTKPKKTSVPIQSDWVVDRVTSH